LLDIADTIFRLIDSAMSILGKNLKDKIANPDFLILKHQHRYMEMFEHE